MLVALLLVALLPQTIPTMQPTLVVGPFNIAPGQTSKGAWTADESRKLRQDLTIGLSKVRIFNILEGDSLEEARAQLKRQGSMQALKNLEPNTLLPGKYFFFGEIVRFDLNEVERTQPYTHRIIKERSLTAEGYFKLVSVIDGSLVCTERVEVKYRTQELDTDIMAKARQDLAGQMTSKLMELLMPITVLSRNGAELTLTLSTDPHFTIGSSLNVYKQGKRLVHPLTGEDLGREDVLQGRIQITEINPKSAKAIVLDESARISERDICRFEQGK